MEETAKTVSQSKVQQIQIVLPQYGNPAGGLFGGQLMAWIDVVAGVVAFRHSGGSCATASVDYLSFDKPIQVNEIIVLEGQVTHIGNSSMEIRVDTYIEKADGLREMANRAYLTFVAVDAARQPRRVPRLTLETDEERQEWNDGVERAEFRKLRRKKTGTPA